MFSALVVMSGLLSGCSFGTTDSHKGCHNGACDCQNDYYGMEAGIYLSGVPVEHASLHVTVPRAEADQDNSSGCCLSLYDLRPVHDPLHNAQSADAKRQFCNSCAKAPNAQLSDAASTCAAPSFMHYRQLSSPSQLNAVTSGTDTEGMDGADNYSDCYYDSTDTIAFAGEKLVSGVRSEFNIRWTDRKNSTEKTCCAAIQPILRKLFIERTSEINWQPLCDSCKGAFNPSVGLAAFRACASEAAMQRQTQQRAHPSAVV